MIDKSDYKKDILEMRQLFWKKVNGRISHEKLMEELAKINNNQMTLEMSEKEKVNV